VQTFALVGIVCMNKRIKIASTVGKKRSVQSLKDIGKRRGQPNSNKGWMTKKDRNR
jgi:hypothetical protein